MSSSLSSERQHEEFLSVLRRADGAELTYDELREAGIEYPASTVSELQLAGVPVERRYRGGRVQPSFRLVPEQDVAVAAEVAKLAAVPAPSEVTSIEADAAPTQAFEPVAAVVRVPWRQRIHPHARRYVARVSAGLAALTPPPVRPARLLSGAALLAAAVTVTVLTLSSLGGGHPRHRPAGHRTRTAAATVHRVASRYDSGPQASGHASQPLSRPAARRSPGKPAAAPLSAMQLQAQGHELLEQGQYASAIPVLQQAANATGESPAACTQPTTENCLTFAFALYDLGVALRLGGNPAAAVSILQLRLQINDARSTVANQLRLAQGDSSSTAAAAQLEATGHSLLQDGQYTSAIALLQQAVKTTAENPGACAQPTSQNCQTYAFALYDLGVALRLSGQPAAAVPILQQRLRINDARQVVADELRLAQSASH
jgi:hypothetical protein